MTPLAALHSSHLERRRVWHRVLRAFLARLSVAPAAVLVEAATAILITATAVIVPATTVITTVVVPTTAVVIPSTAVVVAAPAVVVPTSTVIAAVVVAAARTVGVVPLASVVYQEKSKRRSHMSLLLTNRHRHASPVLSRRCSCFSISSSPRGCFSSTLINATAAASESRATKSLLTATDEKASLPVRGHSRLDLRRGRDRLEVDVVVVGP